MSHSTIALSLVSHTNVGKTTLARTLLGREIGEVRDEAHVTLVAEPYPLIEVHDGARLELWDTPGFGDSLRLAKRLEQQGNPIGWFLSEVWDRFRDRAFWSTQRAIRHILDRADVVLYLVNASERPEHSGHLDAELRVLDLIGKPVIVLLNQLGAPRPAAEEAAEAALWRARTAGAACVREVLSLDAFARCWVHEDTLFEAVGRAVPHVRQALYQRLRDEWRTRALQRFHRSMGVLAERLHQAALDHETVPEAGWTDRLMDVGMAIGLRREGADTPARRAMGALAERLDDDIRASTDRLIELHQLEGRAGAVVLARLAEHFAVRQPVDEQKAALLGGIVTGALAGLKADIASGGLTMGGGLLAGGVLGALGAAGLARGYNAARGIDGRRIAWSDEVLDTLVRSSLLGYLAVAHYGRGRGEWAEAEHPAYWSTAVDAVIAERSGTLQALWKQRQAAAEDRSASRGWLDAMRQFFDEAGDALLTRLYPSSSQVLGHR